MYWNMHISTKINKSIATLWQCRRTYGISWGLSPKMLHWIYSAIIRPRLCYAAIVWWPRCRLDYVQKQLNKIQRLALISITGAMKTAPTAALEAMMNMEPLHIHIEAKARSTALKMKITSTLNDVNYGHSRIWKLMRDRNPELEMPCDFIPPTYRFEKSFRINLPNREEWISSSPIPSTNALPWYTDGSRSHLSGASYHCSQVQCNKSLPLGKYASVFQAEITGISGSCYEITQKKHFTLPIYIFTDSQAAMKSINKNRFTSSLALECRDALNHNHNQKNVSLYARLHQIFPLSK